MGKMMPRIEIILEKGVKFEPMEEIETKFFEDGKIGIILPSSSNTIKIPERFRKVQNFSLLIEGIEYLKKNEACVISGLSGKALKPYKMNKNPDDQLSARFFVLNSFARIKRKNNNIEISKIIAKRNEDEIHIKEKIIWSGDIKRKLPWHLKHFTNATQATLKENKPLFIAKRLTQDVI